MVSGRAVFTLILALVMLAAVQAIVPLMAAQASPSATAAIADGGLIKPSRMFTLATGAVGYARSPAGALTYTAEYTGVGTPIVMTYTDELSQVIEYTITQNVLTVPAQASFYSDAAYVGDYGDVQFQVSAEVSSTSTFLEPQFFVGGSNVDAPRLITSYVVITWTPQFSNAPISGTCATATEWADAQTIHVYDWPVWSQIPGVSWEEPVTFYAKTTGQQMMGFEVTTRGQCVRLRYEIDTVDRTFFPRIWARVINRK